MKIIKFLPASTIYDQFTCKKSQMKVYSSSIQKGQIRTASKTFYSPKNWLFRESTDNMPWVTIYNMMFVYVG